MNNVLNNGIPVATALGSVLESEDLQKKVYYNKRRLLAISALAVLIAVIISFAAKLLVWLINLLTNIFFFGSLSVQNTSPAENHLGIWVMLIPVAGGLLVGLMAYYGSKAIRGHGIPEAMEQILTNQSKIKPSIIFLKPISSAISIGSGGPFGAEGPIIATGGALGSTLGQLLKISDNERKILLAAGATAGMSAIFGTPVAAVFLAIELLLFEFSPRSIIPVALACITGAAGHHFLFEAGYAFAPKMPMVDPSNTALFAYSIMGIAIGLLSVGVTKIVYIFEDLFEKLPFHWAWWPAVGGIAVGVIGYFYPKTLGVGYNNIADLVSGNLTLQVIFYLCIMKFLSWSISLASGTSGGTLAPLLTIGGAAGALIGGFILKIAPASGVTIPLAALVGMSAMFAGASRAFLTSIIFALEATGQSAALLPLLGSCTASYFVSFLTMENTIMTEKIARRGVKTPDSYEPDILDRIRVEEVLNENGSVFSEENTIGEIRDWYKREGSEANYFIIVSNEGLFKGIISASNLLNMHHDAQKSVGSLIKRKLTGIDTNSSLRAAVEMMAKENIDVLPVLSAEAGNQLQGILSYREIIAAYKSGIDEHGKKDRHISARRGSLKIILRGRNLLNKRRSK